MLLQGTYMCSLRGDCSWTVYNDSSVGMIEIMRVLRVFRIVWIVKHLRVMRMNHVLSMIAVSM